MQKTTHWHRHDPSALNATYATRNSSHWVKAAARPFESDLARVQSDNGNGEPLYGQFPLWCTQARKYSNGQLRRYVCVTEGSIANDSVRRVEHERMTGIRSHSYALIVLSILSKASHPAAACHWRWGLHVRGRYRYLLVYIHLLIFLLIRLLE